jgi:hypothetical protein
MNIIKRVRRKLERMYLSTLDDEQHARVCYRWRFGKEPDLENPRSFVEKMLWLMLHEDTKSYARLVDKYEVRSVVAERIGERYLNELYFVTDDPDSITEEMLPERFALKATHGSGYNIIHDGASPFDLEGAKKQLRKWFSRDYSDGMRERQYSGLKPKVICERYLSDDSGTLRDYKFFCFGGEPLLAQVDVDRYTTHRRGLYRPDWTEVDATYNRYPKLLSPVPKPENLDEMLACSRELSRGLRFVRIDFYQWNGRTIFGEITFHPAGGLGEFSPDSYNYEFGDLIDIGDAGKRQ